MTTTVLQHPTPHEFFLSTKTCRGGNVPATFQYIDTSSPGFNDPITFPKDPKDRENILNLPGNRKPMVEQKHIVTDVSNDMYKYTLDLHGFQYVKHRTQCKETVFADDDDERIKANYFPEVVDMLKDITGASYIYIFDYVARGPVKQVSDNPTTNPVHYVHCDQSYNGARTMVRTRLPDEALALDILSEKRFQIINVWRPIKTIYKDPFGTKDARSVPESDLVPMPISSGGIVEESWGSRPSPSHHWYFKYAQQPDEVMLFKCFDSLDDGQTARRVLHSAFTDPAEEAMPPRESVEIRAILAYDV